MCYTVKVSCRTIQSEQKVLSPLSDIITFSVRPHWPVMVIKCVFLLQVYS